MEIQENWKAFNIFVFIKISCQSEEFPPLVQLFLFLEKIFHSHPHCKVRGDQTSPLQVEGFEISIEKKLH